MIEIEGFFTKDEIASALAMNAEIRLLPFGRRSLTFATESGYQKWLADQMSQHPERWAGAVHLPPTGQK